jgi:hypothetical protein
MENMSSKKKFLPKNVELYPFSRNGSLKNGKCYLYQYVFVTFVRHDLRFTLILCWEHTGAPTAFTVNS